jgi:hypothetical protein
MPPASEKPTPGQIARLRQRFYLVERTVPPPMPGDSTLVSLSCVDDDAQGQPLEVLWEQEIDREIQTGEAWEAIADRGFDPPSLFAAYLNTLKWNCVTSTDPRLFQAFRRWAFGVRREASFLLTHDEAASMVGEVLMSPGARRQRMRAGPPLCRTLQDLPMAERPPLP